MAKKLGKQNAWMQQRITKMTERQERDMTKELNACEIELKQCQSELASK